MDSQYVITISHQFGSGGAEIGKKLSEKLSIPFVDRQILKQVAEKLDIPEAEIESREERATSFWHAFTRLEAFNDPFTAIGAEYYPSDRELYELESEFIGQIAEKSSAIILGRGARYILRNHPRHLCVFVHADMNDRARRVSRQSFLTKAAAQKLIEKNDRERNAYLKNYTRLEWLDARTYDLCINTSSTGIDNAVDMIAGSLTYKFDTDKQV